MALLNRLLPPAKPDRFAQMMMKALRRVGVEGPIEYDAEEFRLVIKAERGRMIYLSNAYAEYRAAPVRARKRATENYVAFGREPPPKPPEQFDEAKASLLPRVRDRFYYESLRLHWRIGGATMLEFPTRPLTNHLTVELAYDFPKSVMTVTQKQLDEWGVGFDEAMAVAKDNLWKRSNEVFVAIAPGVYVSPWRDTHDASRLLLHDLIWQLEVKGDHVAMIPHRDLLVVSGSEDTNGLRKMAEITTEALEDPRAMTGIPVRLRNTSWQPFFPSRDHPAYGDFKNLQVQTVVTEYTRQQELLKSLYQKTGENVFVASTIAVKDKETGVLSTVCSWARGVDALLPRTDMIGFTLPDEAKGHQVACKATWKDVEAEVSELMEPAGFYPERYRVREFPTPEQLSRMATGT